MLVEKTSERWYEEQRKYFSIEMNGYRNPPELQYASILPLIDRDGKVLDAGCGNGMLLKFLMEFSGHNIVPFGIDTWDEAIEQAKTEVARIRSQLY
ncbi:MAG: class I SAM-dependent methyltransferase [Candidatus Aenigmarchaeota archaeon]|nr:class I SAM-dependent methyltransferase [Candidatus Aenigmarchaeota archaeon]